MTVDLEQLYERIVADMRTQRKAGVEVRDHRYGLMLYLRAGELTMQWADDSRHTCCALMSVVATATGPDNLLRHGPVLSYAMEQQYLGQIIDKVHVAAILLDIPHELAQEIMQGFDLMESPISLAYPAINQTTEGYQLGARLRDLADEWYGRIG